MSGYKNEEYLSGLVNELCRLPDETEWTEFKVNNTDPKEIGEYISALSNSAALNNKGHGYIVWGVDDTTHEIVGTKFIPASEKTGNEPLETWLLRLLNPRIHFRFYEISIDGKPVVILEIDRAFRHPVRFKNEAFIRVGTVKKPLKDVPDRERELWHFFDEVIFEEDLAAERISSDDVLRLLDYPAYFDRLDIPLPDNREGILNALISDNLINSCEAGGFDITNLGAILIAKKLSDFPKLKRKSLRIIQYRGTGRIDTIREKEIDRGYANGFYTITECINSLVPSNEIIEQALRKTVPMFPEIAIRELVVNALIHQDFYITGAGPMVEIFSDRIEITNPGEPLVDTERFVDTPPKSRNEILASIMRRFCMCEERGSGIDKVITQVEYYQLPAPIFEVPPGFTRVVLFAHRPLSEMDKNDRIRAVYQHACLCYVNRKQMVNASLRERFDINKNNKSTASKYIKDALDAGMIRAVNPKSSAKLRAYIPYWA